MQEQYGRDFYETLAKLRGDMRDFVAEPLVPTAAELAADPPTTEQQPRSTASDETLPIDHFWREEAEYHQRRSGEESQE